MFSAGWVCRLTLCSSILQDIILRAAFVRCWASEMVLLDCEFECNGFVRIGRGESSCLRIDGRATLSSY